MANRSDMIRIKLYLHTERHHRGVVVPCFLRSLTGDTPKEKLGTFKQFCFKQLNAHTPVMRVYKVPSHELLKSVRGIEDGGEYLVLGKEYTLGRPNHRSRNYPQILVKRRVSYLRQKKARQQARASDPVEEDDPISEPVREPEILPPAEEAGEMEFAADVIDDMDEDPSPSSSPSRTRSKRRRGQGRKRRGGGGVGGGVQYNDRASPGYSRVGRLKPLPKFGYVGPTHGGRLKVKLYLNTERHHRGVVVTVPMKRFENSGSDAKGQLTQFKQWCYDSLQAHTPIMRIYEIPSHRLLRRIADLKPDASYLVVGKEFTLGKPSHLKRDYPLALVDLRRDYLRRNPGSERRRARGRS